MPARGDVVERTIHTNNHPRGRGNTCLNSQWRREQGCQGGIEGRESLQFLFTPGGWSREVGRIKLLICSSMNLFLRPPICGSAKPEAFEMQQHQSFYQEPEGFSNPINQDEYSPGHQIIISAGTREKLHASRLQHSAPRWSHPCMLLVHFSTQCNKIKQNNNNKKTPVVILRTETKSIIFKLP